MNLRSYQPFWIKDHTIPDQGEGLEDMFSSILYTYQVPFISLLVNIIFSGRQTIHLSRFNIMRKQMAVFPLKKKIGW